MTRLRRYWNGLCALGIILCALLLCLYTALIWLPAYGLACLFAKAWKRMGGA